MKKRILALALAGTTAFSVFGAAVTADAASSHVVYGNDAYTSYKSGEIKVSSTTNLVAGNYYTTNGAGNKWTEAYPYMPESEHGIVKDYTTDNSARELAATTGSIKADGTSYWDGLYKSYYNADVYYKYNGMGLTKVTTGTRLYIGIDGVVVTTQPTTADNVVTVNTNTNAVLYTTANGSDVYFDLIGDKEAAEAFATLKNAKAGYQAIVDGTGSDADKADAKARIAAIDAFLKDHDLTQEITDTINTYWPVPEVYSSTAESLEKVSYTATATGNLDADPLSRNGNTVVSGDIYAYDYYTIVVSPSMLSNAYDAAAFQWNKNYNGYVSTRDTAALSTAVDGLSQNKDQTLNTDDAVLGRTGGYNYNREDVINEYEDFLVEIGVLKYGWGSNNLVPGVSEKDFLESYSYKYNNNIDEYNFEGLVSDLYDTIETATSYVNTPSSELVYLMQQYDKYVDGSYIGETEIDESAWADLLIECLNAVTADDFTTASAYNSYNRAAELAIYRYENATTPAQQRDAIAKLYEAVTASYGRAAASDKTELTASLNDLYFNNKSIPAAYLTEVDDKSQAADLVLYGYDKAHNVVESSVNAATTAAKAIYPLYPAADYYQKDREGAEYAGTAYEVIDDVTAEYEWFANVYQLAAKINSRTASTSYQGMIDTVNAALNEAVDALAPTKTPAGSTTLRMEEAVEEYAGKIDTDYVAKYYNAYTKANEFAEVAEGNMQTKYATEMAIISGETLGYQSTQNTVTKGMIGDLNTAIKNAKAALEVIKADADYNAAQVNALNKAISNAQYIVDRYDGTVADSVNKISNKNTGDKDSFVISDVTKAIEAIDAAINYSEVKLGWTETEDGKWQYGYEKEDGTLAYVESGWYRVGNSWFYFEKGTAVESDWRQIDGKWYYLNPSCAAAYGWTKVDGNWYYFNQDNSMKTGWLKSAGHWYYLAPSGKMATGWAQVDGKWYYFSKTENAIGQMLANTTTPDGCKVDENGVWVK